MKRLLTTLFIIALGLTVAACNPNEPPPASPQMTIKEITTYKTPIIQFGIPQDSLFVLLPKPTIENGYGMQLQNGDFDIYLGLDTQQKDIDKIPVYCSYQEMIDYRMEATTNKFYEVSYSDMDGYAQVYNSGRVILLFPIDDSLQRNIHAPQVFKVVLTYKGNDVVAVNQFQEARKALDNFISTKEVQMILNSIQLLPDH